MVFVWGGGGAVLMGWEAWGAERADGIYAFPLILLSCLKQVINVYCEQVCRVKSSQKIQVKVAEQEFPYISARRYIIITKLNI